MPHLIEDNQIAYKGQKPWHGLGYQVNDKMDGREMLEVAHLNWRVEPRPLSFAATDRDFLSECHTFGTHALANFSAITRTDDNRVFSVVRKGYQIVQNQEIVDFFREYCEAGYASMEVVGALRGGSVVWALAKLPKTTMVLAGEDELTGYLLLTTSHDQSSATTAKATQIRVVCYNTLTAALNRLGESFRLSHRSKFNEVQRQKARVVLGMASERIAADNEVAHKLSGATIDSAGWLAFIARLMGDEAAVIDARSGELSPTVKAIHHATTKSPGAELESAKGTFWGAVNGVTYFADHVRGRKPDSRLESAWFGDSARLKRRAVEVALELTGC